MSTALPTAERTGGSKPVGILGIIGLILVPLMAAGILVWSLWSPDERLNTVAAAIVNNDEPVEIDGQPVPLGRQLVAGLMASQPSGGDPDDVTDTNYTWSISQSESAADGLADGTYAAVITIPEGFSEAATSTTGEPSDARRATIDIATADNSKLVDDAISQMISQTAAATMGTELTTVYLDNVYLAFNTIGDSIGEAADGAEALTEGTQALRDGTRQLSDGTDELANGTRELATGARTLADQGGQLRTGASTAAEGAGGVQTGATGLATAAQALAAGAGELDSGTGALASAAGDLSSGLGELRSSSAALPAQVDQLNAGAQELNDAVSRIGPALAAQSAEFQKQLEDNSAAAFASLEREGAAITEQLRESIASCLTNVGPVPPDGGDGSVEQIEACVAEARDTASVALQASVGTALNALAPDLPAGDAFGGLDELSTATAQLAQGTSALASGIPALTGGIAAAADGAGALQTGIEEVSTATGELTTGASGLATGATQLATGAGELSTGIGTLSQGVDAYVTGAGTLATGVDGISTATTQLNEATTGLRDGARELNDGADELASGLTTAVDELPHYSSDERSTLSDAASSPVEVDDAGNAGDLFGGNAGSFFAALALWAGALATFVVLRAWPRNALASTRSPFRLALHSATLPAIIGAVQGALVAIVLQPLMELSVGAWFGFAGVAVVAGVAFALVAQALMTLFRGTGWFLSLAILVVTLATGIISTSPAALDTVAGVLPTASAQSAFNAVVNGGSPVAGLVGLAVFAGVSFVVTALVIGKRRTVSTRTLARPAIA